MNIVGTMLARNEDWALALTARAALRWVDQLVILDHASTDETPKIIGDLNDDYPGRVVNLYESDPIWHEMRYRQRMLEAARALDATHIAIIDADEILTGNLVPHMRSLVDQIPLNQIFSPRWLCLRGSIDRYHIAGTWGRSNVSLVFRDHPKYHWTAQGVEGYDFHHRHPMGAPCQAWMPGHRISGGLMHLQMVSDRRLRAKQALYKMTEVLRWPNRKSVAQLNAQYDLAVYGDIGAAAHALGETQRDWWDPYIELQRHLHVYAEPWQEAECQRLWSEHGAQRFIGLDLFGVVK